jgi:hypothetical protein
VIHSWGKSALEGAASSGGAAPRRPADRAFKSEVAWLAAAQRSRETIDVGRYHGPSALCVDGIDVR